MLLQAIPNLFWNTKNVKKFEKSSRNKNRTKNFEKIVDQKLVFDAKEIW